MNCLKWVKKVYVITMVSVGKGWDDEVCLGVVTFSPQSAATGTVCPPSACLRLAKCSNTHVEWSCLNLQIALTTLKLPLFFFFISSK